MLCYLNTTVQLARFPLLFRVFHMGAHSHWGTTKDRELQEEALTKAVLEESEKFQVQVEKVAEPSHASAAQPAKPTGKSFCNRSVGICEVGQQVASKLAKCRHCMQPIPKYSARIGWAYSRTKFHAWVHSECFPQLLRAEAGDVNQAIDFITSWQERQGPDSNSGGYKHDISQLLENLLDFQRAGNAASASGACSSRG